MNGYDPNDFDSAFTADGKINFAARVGLNRDNDPILNARYRVDDVPPPKAEPPDLEDDLDEW